MNARNILLIHCDALVHSMLGAMGHRQVRTPNIDALAAEGGTVFENAYTCNGICVPSRASLMTGRYPIAHGVVNNNIALPSGEATMGQIFASHGYATGYFGKTHFGRPSDDMAAEGWRESFLWSRQYNEYLKDHGISVRYPEKKPARNRLRYWSVGASAIPAEHYHEKVISDKAIDFMRAHRHEPFLCFVANVAPHGPFTPPGPYDALFDPSQVELLPRPAGELDDKPPATVRWVRQNQKYVNDDELRIYLAAVYGLIVLIDDGVGRIVRALKESGLYDRTLIVFTSDHGDFASRYGILGKSWCSIEHLIHVPLIISAPGLRGHALRRDALTDNTDILPTLLEYAGLQPSPKVQGRSLWPVLMGRTAAVREAVYGYGQFEYSGGMMAQSMVRQGQWKLLQTQDGFTELYNLTSDPLEVRNLAGGVEFRPQVEELRQRLLNWHVAGAGGYFDVEKSAFWEDETLFYDEKRFCGERQVRRGNPP